MRALLVLALLAASPAFAEDGIPILAPEPKGMHFFQEPNTADYVLQATFVSIVLVDWMQTINFTQHGTAGYETNPLLGRYPSRAKVNTLIPLAIVGHTAIAYALPRPLRTIWQATWIVVEIDAVSTNFKYGAGISLPWN